MSFIIKLVLYAITIGLLGTFLSTWYKTYVLGQLFLNSDILMTVMGAILPILILTGAFYAIRAIYQVDLADLRKNFAIVIIILAGATITGCTYASANVQTVISDDCGVTWQKINPGQSVPTRVGVCKYKVTVPDYPLQGDYRFKASFANRVLAEVEVSYDYSIIDAITFIGEAKYLGKPNSDSDDASNSASVYESAENAVIDRRIREVAANLLLKEDIVDFSQGEFEDRLMTAINEQLKTRGVQLNSIAFVPTPEEQTRLAIDMMTAMKVYESKGLSDLGQKVAVARASATKIEVGKEPSVTTQK